jgi:hypothetical protein
MRWSEAQSHVIQNTAERVLSSFMVAIGSEVMGGADLITVEDHPPVALRQPFHHAPAIGEGEGERIQVGVHGEEQPVGVGPAQEAERDPSDPNDIRSERVSLLLHQAKGERAILVHGN